MTLGSVEVVQQRPPLLWKVKATYPDCEVISTWELMTGVNFQSYLNSPQDATHVPMADVTLVIAVEHSVPFFNILFSVTLHHHHHHHIRFWYLWCCGCPGLRGRQHLATPHTRSP